MEDTLQSFKQDLANLEHYVRGLELESGLISFDKRSVGSLLRKYQKHISEARQQRRQFNYNAIIITLYGFLEQFIESLLESYLKQINRIIPKYSQLPDSVSKNYTDLTIEFMKYLDEPIYEGLATKEDLISDLYSCITDSEDYRINPYPFIHHTANFRFQMIERLFSNVGVGNVSGRVIKSYIFTEYLRRNDPPSVDHTTPESALSDLNDLVKRRNEVAHGELPNEFLDNRTILENYIPLLEVYGESLYEVVYSDVLKYQVEYNGTELGSPIGIYKQGKVIGISVEDMIVKVGDLLAAKTANQNIPYIAGKIEELQVDNISREEVSASTAGVDIGIHVPFRAKQNQTFFLIRKNNPR
ncbi:MAE_28990/MAE_18760 family HEPN-like nuclease [Desulfococcaceae bacterium HSG8]|nr:MAE_28990/MAE_18760 family HEPN-like nuclease [Desulfococcaceae bacterium HSG8]